MNKLFVAFSLALFATVAVAAGNDTVNERIPVTAAELQDHWRVDCGLVWQELSSETDSTAATAAPISLCGLSADTRRKIQLCAFIYQPPGEQRSQQCRDFAAVLSFITDNEALADCSSSLPDVINSYNCENEPP